MDEQEYVELVVAQVYAKTMENRLKWQVEWDLLTAEPVKSIQIRIRYKSKGPDSAVWDSAFITSPVDGESSMITNPEGPSGRLATKTGSATLQQIDEIFARFVLEPRRKQFEAALAELKRA